MILRDILSLATWRINQHPFHLCILYLLRLHKTLNGPRVKNILRSWQWLKIFLKKNTYFWRYLLPFSILVSILKVVNILINKPKIDLIKKALDTSVSSNHALVNNIFFFIFLYESSLLFLYYFDHFKKQYIVLFFLFVSEKLIKFWKRKYFRGTGFSPGMSEPHRQTTQEMNMHSKREEKQYYNLTDKIYKENCR